MTAPLLLSGREGTLSRSTRWHAWRNSLCALISILLALCVASVTRHHFLHGTETYPDFIVGLIGIEDYYKTGEQHWFLFAFIAALAIAFLLSFFAERLFTKTATQGMSETQIAYACLWTLCGVLLGLCFMNGGLKLSTWSAASGLLLLGFLASWAGSAIRDAFSGTLLAGLFLAFSLLAFIVVRYQFNPTATIASEDLEVLITVSLSLGLVAFLMLHFFAPSWARILFVFLQCLLPLLMLRVLNIRFNGPDGISAIEMHTRGKACMLLLVIGAWIEMLNLFWRASRAHTYATLIAYSSLFSLAFYLSFQFPWMSTLNADEFHLGEMMLPWHQVVEHGQSAYREFVPVQGLVGYVLGFLNYFFYGGKIVSFQCATSLLACLTTGCIVLALSLHVGRALALLFIPLALPFLDRFYLASPALIVMAHPSLLRRPPLWAFCSGLFVGIALFWNPTSGLSLAGAASVFALTVCVRAVWRKKLAASQETAIFVGSGLLGVGIAALTLPLIGVLQFVYENGYINTVQHASVYLREWGMNPNFPKYFESPWWNAFLWESIRFGGWMVVALLLLVMGMGTKSLRGNDWIATLRFICFGGVMFLLLLSPYSMGRVDPPQYLSRVGTTSMLALQLFLPLAAAISLVRLQHVLVPPLLVGFLIAVPVSLRGMSLAAAVQIPTGEVQVDGQHELIDGKEIGLPKLGLGYFPKVKIAATKELGAALKKLLKPGETYADLANKSIYFVTLDYEFPTLYPSANAIGARIQKRILAKFRADRPAVFLVQPMIEFDGACAALRNYRIYRWLMREGYRLHTEGQFQFLVSPDRFKELGPVTLTRTTEEETNLRKVFFRPTAGGIPRAWGKSYSSLKELVDHEPVSWVSSGAEGVEPQAERWFSVLEPEVNVKLRLLKPVQGNKCDYLMLNLEREGKGRSKIQAGFRWSPKEDSQSLSPELHFKLSPGVSILPVGGDPLWLLGEARSFELSLHQEKKGAKWRIKSMSCLLLRDET